MRYGVKSLALALFASSAIAGTAYAQASYPCVNDAPNPYKLAAAGWATTPRPWSHPLAAAVDTHDNLWIFDRCEEAGCAASKIAPIFELGPDGKTKANFGGGQFVFPHGIAVDKDGNVWAADGDAKDGRGMQVVKLSPQGKELMRLGKAGQGSGSKALDTFDQPTAVVVASNGDIFVAEGHGPKFGNSRIVKFDKTGKFIKTFGTLGSGDGELKEPHAMAIDKQDRLYIADRNNARVDVFDKDGKFLAAWKQFGRPSGIWVDGNDMLYTVDSQSAADPKSPNYNAGCKMGIRVGSIKDGKVAAFIPERSAEEGGPESVGVDDAGTIYAGWTNKMFVRRFVKN
jgi:hypothetical protein